MSREDELDKEWAEKVDPIIDAANEAHKREQEKNR